MSQWVNFKTVRESLDLAQVLRDYGVELTLKGDQATAFCPLPGHKSRSTQKSKSFSVNLKKGIFQCFGCQAKGNVLDFAVLMEGLDPTDTTQFRQGVLKLQERYLDAPGAKRAPVPVQVEDVSDTTIEEGENDYDADLPRIVNAPLGFELKSLDPKHPYLKKRGLTEETIAYFGLGYCGKGMLKGRIAIPLRDSEGKLIGYAGRLIDDQAVSDAEPKYKLPGSRKADGGVCDFRKSEFLFNGFRFQEPLNDLVVVEGFFGAMWMHQCGYHNVVALMGAACSARQSELLTRLVRPDGHLWLMPDGDDAGEKCAANVLRAVAQARFVRWVKLEASQQPENFTEEMLARLLW